MELGLAHALYKLFAGRRDTYAIQRIGKDNEAYYYRIVGKEVSPDTYAQHISGEEIVGIYPTLTGGKCSFAAVDLDSPDTEMVEKLRQGLPQPNYVERSRSGNHHIWMFFKKPVKINDLEKLCRETIIYTRNLADTHCGLYPLPSKKKDGLGLLIALPLQGAAVNQSPALTVFLDEEGNEIADSLHFLQNIKYTKLRSSSKLHTKRLWSGEGKESGDISRSGYDFSLTQALASKNGAVKDLIHGALVSKPLGKLHSDEEMYIERTLQRATTPVQQEYAQRTQGWEDIKPLNRKEFFQASQECMILGDTQKQQLDIFYATIIANLKTKGRPIWLLFIGPPGCGKTMPMMAIQHSPYTYSVSAFRPAALISGWGMKGGTDVSLIPKLQDKILMVKDMSSLLSQNQEVVQEVMGLLRDAYDGSCARHFGTGVERTYKSRFGFIGAATPDIDAHWSLNVRLGERFIRLRLTSSLDQIYGKIDKGLENLLMEDVTDSSLETASLGYLKHLMREDGELPAFAQAKEIGRLAQLGAILRTTVSRGVYSRQILVIPEWEEATRYSKQLAKMAVALAYVRGKSANGDEEMEDLKLIVRHGMDGKMEKLCALIYKREDSTTSELSSALGMPTGVIRAWLDDLNISRVIVGERSSYEMRWKFVPLIQGMLNHFKLWKKGDNGEQERY